jgi:hypothetical protein
MDLNLGNGYVETEMGHIIIKNVRIDKKDTLEIAFDDQPFYVNFETKDDYLKLLKYGVFHIELIDGKILVDCKLENSNNFVDENTDMKGYYSFSRL